MRLTTVDRRVLGRRLLRLDPAFYFGHRQVRATVDTDDSRHARLRDLVESIQDGARLPVAPSGIRIVRLNNIRACELDLSQLASVDGTAAKWPEIQAGDVLFTRAAEPFRAAAVLEPPTGALTASAEVAIIRPRPAVAPEYLAAMLSTPTIGRLLSDLAYRGRRTALPRLRLPDVGRLPIPLPPRHLQEQIREQYRQALDLNRSARAEIAEVRRGLHREIDHRLGELEPPPSVIQIPRRQLPERWDVSFARGQALRERLARSAIARPLLDLARPASSSLRGLDENEQVLAVQADDVNATTFLIEGAKVRPLAELSARMRQPLEPGDVLLCTTGDGDQVAYLDEEIGQDGHRILGSSTFTALRFGETPRVFAVTLTHPLVRRQLRLLASGSVQRFVNKRDLDALLIPVLGRVWRDDFEARLHRAMQRRREALIAQSAVIDIADAYLQERLP